MALKGYFGSPGSGKTYEVVENVILPAIVRGRRVVTNIAGLDYEAICDYLVAKGHERETLGTIFTIQLNEDIAGKFAVIEGDGEQAKLIEEKSIIRGGDMLVLDEVWRVWEDGQKIHSDDRRFLRMHRHLVHPVSLATCDIAIIAQNFTDVHRQVRSLVEERYEMSKHLALGMRNRYRVSIYTKGSRKPHQNLQKKYKSEIHELYKSHSMGKEAGKEVEVDGRGNIFKGALFTVFLPLAILAGIAGIYGVRYFFSGDGFKTKEQKQKLLDEKTAASSSTIVKPAALPQPLIKQDDLSPFRVSGYASDGKVVVLFIDVGGRSLLQRAADKDSLISGQYVETILDGRRIGTYSGYEKKAESSMVPLR